MEVLPSRISNCLIEPLSSFGADFKAADMVVAN